MDKVHICVLMMLKNEKARLQVSLDSIKGFANSLVVFDTGSTDNTIKICEEFCKKYNIPFRLKQGEFKNFSTSRNESLDFADTFDDIDYILLLDCNDELKGSELLRKEAIKYKNEKNSSFLLTQQWFSGTYNSYYNARFIKARKGWRYIGVVHEYLKNINPEDDTLDLKKLDSDIKLYQDRTKDDDKTGKRFLRDKEMLLAEYKKDPSEPRTCFYLAQTFSCINDFENAYYYYKQRIDLIGFYEEIFQSYLKCGELSERLNHNWYDSFVWYMKAYNHIPRVEPLVRIANYYLKEKNYMLAFTFIDLACKLNYPDNCILFVEKFDYDYKRWHLLGIAGFYTGNYKEGKIGCLKAIESGERLNVNTEHDKKNLEFYESKEKEIMANNTSYINPNNLNNNTISNYTNNMNNMNNTNITKNKFIELKVNELKRTNPNAKEKQLVQIAKLQWKKSKM